MSDIHLDPDDRRTEPSPDGDDTNPALLASALAEMKRVDPSPPAIVISGDFLGHHFNYAEAGATMNRIADLFGRAFPSSQFILALGNEDSGCADYGFGLDSAFGRAVAKAWGPLVNRNGAAPDFATTFAHDGFYVARLPGVHADAIVIDDVFWSPFSRPCGARSASAGASEMMAQLRKALARRGERHLILAHIPPGIDAYATNRVARRFVVVPYLQPQPAAEFLGLIGDPANNVAAVVAAHAHRFAYRIAGAEGNAPVPVLIVPAISPIFQNAPAFLTVDVAPSGTIRSAEVHARSNGRWSDIGGTRSLGLSEFDGAGLVRLQQRLATDASARATFAGLYGTGGEREIDERNWRWYWCVAANFTPDAFRKCAGAGGFGLLTGRALALGAVAFLAFCAFCALALALLRRRSAQRRT